MKYFKKNIISTKSISLISALSIMIICLIFAFIFMQNTMSAQAEENSNSDVKYIDSLFLENEIEETGCLYNFDGSIDYFYIDFQGSSGYAIFAEDTLEMLEYAAIGEFPYTDSIGKKYYGGPQAYFVQENYQLVNICTKERLPISAESALALAELNRNNFSLKAKSVKESENITDVPIEKIQTVLGQVSFRNNSEDLTIRELGEPSDPPVDTKNPISPTAGAHYVDNYNYFLSSPKYGVNTKGSCTTVATQLMLSYNNYYYDRRIIPNEYLNGSKDVNPERNPNFCSNPLAMNREVLGSNNAYHDYLYNRGVTGYLYNAKPELIKILNERNSQVDDGLNFTVDCKDTYPNALNSQDILNEINEGRPVVICTDHLMNGTTGATQELDHTVLAYGYQNLAPYHDGKTYLGYIVNFGWATDSNPNYQIQVWTNSAWYYSYLSLNISHEHNYNVTTNNIFDDGLQEIKCGECGHRTLANVYTVTLQHENSIGQILYDKIKVAYGEKMPTPTVYNAPKKDGYEFLGYFSQPNGKGTQYYSKDIEYKPLVLTSVGYVEGYREIMVSCNSWNVDGSGTLYAHWKQIIHTKIYG